MIKNLIAFLLLGSCLCLFQPGPVNAQNQIVGQEVTSITVRGQTIKLGDKADDVFAILKGDDKTRPPATRRNPNKPYGLIVTHFYRLENKVLEITLTLPEANGPYRVKNILIRGTEAESPKTEKVSTHLPQNTPKYKVIGRDGPSVSILVHPKTTSEQLKSLLMAFRIAREQDTFQNLETPVTSWSIKGDVVTVMIYVFSKPIWASEAKLKQFLSPKDLGSKKERLQFVKNFANNVRAYYYYAYNSLSGEPFTEEGTIGYSTSSYGEKITTKDYKRVF
jgi:hypothetical protein